MSSNRNRNRRPRQGVFAQAARDRRTAAKKEEHQPGQASSTLRRRMGDALADIFDEFGPDIYAETTLSLKDVILEKFQQGFEQLDQTIQEELGKRGIEESRQHIRGWAAEIVEDVNHFGLNEVASALEDYVGSLTAEFQQPEAEEGDDLLEVGEDDIEPVEEVDEQDVEPADEADEGDMAEDELNLEDLGLELPEEEAAARFGPLGGRRRRPARRVTRRSARQRALPREARRTRRPFAARPFVGSAWEEEYDQPVYEEDAFMQDARGGGIELSVEGKYIDTFDSQEEAEEALRLWAEQNNYFPTLWYINDHGNVSDPIPY